MTKDDISYLEEVFDTYLFFCDENLDPDETIIEIQKINILCKKFNIKPF